MAISSNLNKIFWPGLLYTVMEQPSEPNYGSRPTSKLDMSLDDVIKNNRATGQRRHNKQEGSRRGGRGGRDNNNHRRSYPREERGSLRFTVSQDRPSRLPRVSPAISGHATEDPACHLTVTNIHHDVSQEDLQQLFEMIGPLRQVRLHYDRAGRSTGVADVVYQYRRDAQTACSRYHGVPLDGMPMRIETHSNALPLRSSTRSSRTVHPTRRRREEEAPVNLDHDLDNYMMQG